MPAGMLTSDHRYLRLSLQPYVPEELRIRHNLHQALLESFGVTGGSINLDVLWVAHDGSETVIRVHPESVSSGVVLD